MTSITQKVSSVHRVHNLTNNSIIIWNLDSLAQFNDNNYMILLQTFDVITTYSLQFLGEYFFLMFNTRTTWHMLERLVLDLVRLIYNAISTQATSLEISV